MACCMFAIATNALYTSLRRRGTTRQLARAIVVCVISALLLLPAIVWYNVRFASEQTVLSSVEIMVVLIYIALFGWFVPLAATTFFCLFALPRTSTTSAHIPRQYRTTRANSANALKPPRHQPGVLAPYVFREDTPWGWITYRGGRFQGQKLALMRVVITIGRDEDNDIWLDDDMASRHHAELAWDKDHTYITDCDSLNGVLLNGRRIRGTAILENGEMLEIGSHRFLFEKAESPLPLNEQDDPLSRHAWHSSVDLPTDSIALPLTQTPREENGQYQHNSARRNGYLPHTLPGDLIPTELQDTAELNEVAPLSPSPEIEVSHMVLMIRDGEMAGQVFVLENPVTSIGRGIECDIAINDVSISRRHAQILRQSSNYYVQDLTSRNGTKVNDELLTAPRLLKLGDIICVGSVSIRYMEYEEPTEIHTPLPATITSF
ncbi:MAG TPA: FHA domain-containing protein, partial [Ktedonobacteraceae bacterium]|nr:FHA domain-containing protein [Ktedonobacteraceae bacterium]